MSQELMAPPVVESQPSGGAVGLALEGGMLTPEIVSSMEKQVELVKRMRLVVCKLTESSHWQDFSGVPYLKDGGIHVIASTIGVEFGEPVVHEDRCEDDKGQFVRYTCELSGAWRGRKLHEVGTSSTRDPFFAIAKQKAVPLSEINLGNVRKKSITNAQHRVLSKITGLGGVTWELLDSIGIHRGEGGTTRFRGSERKQATGAGEWTQEKQKLWGMLLEIYGGEEEKAAEYLFRATDNPSKGYRGIRDPAELTSGILKWLVPKVEAELAKRQRDQAAEGSAEREAGAEG